MITDFGTLKCSPRASWSDRKGHTKHDTENLQGRLHYMMCTGIKSYIFFQESAINLCVSLKRLSVSQTPSVLFKVLWCMCLFFRCHSGVIVFNCLT